jgi:hypothetical protein
MKTYTRNKGTEYKPRLVVVPKESDICAVCGWSIGTKRAIVTSNKDIIHDRTKCKKRYKISLSLQVA